MKKLLKLFTALMILSSCFLISCTQNNQDEKINLTEGWNYSLNNPFTENADFQKLDDSNLDNLQNLIPEQKGTIWLKKDFILPETLQNQDLSCYLGRITIADRTYFNGTLIGNEGYFPPHEFTAWNTARLYKIPSAIINQNSENTLLIEIYIDGEGSIVSNPFIGIDKTARSAAEKERFWNSQINALFAFMMIIIALYHFMMWLKDKEQKEILYFAIINIVSVLYMSVFYLPELPGHPNNKVSFIWFQKIFSSAIPFVLPFFINTFVNEFFKRKDKKIIFVFRILFLAIPVLVILCAPDYVHLRKWRIYYQSFLLPPIAYIVVLISKACVQKQKDSVPLLLGFTPLLITMFLDVALHDWLKIFSLPYLSSIGWQLVIIALLFVLVNRFANAKKQAEYLNIHLKDEVDKRTKELSESNEKLTTVNTQLEFAQHTAEKDMKLAAYVQQSFFPRWAPNVEDWDVAFKFQPSAGVSGDLYDFFTKHNKLTGVALFDVSGHGIASGLVTMLAKNAISRKFTPDMDVKLATVMQEINERIIEDKGNVENYLTGILLRMDGNHVQMVNAGHPAVFLRKTNGKCYPVQTKSTTQGNSSLIGFAELNADFKTINFTVEPGDSLILYTDCLSESKNVNNEEYGQDNVSKSFSHSGSGNAQSKLNNVLADFENFTKGTNLKDDLTIIVLQKK